MKEELKNAAVLGLWLLGGFAFGLWYIIIKL